MNTSLKTIATWSLAFAGAVLFTTSCADPLPESESVDLAPAPISNATSSGAQADFLYIGDGIDDTVKRFAAINGKYLGIFVQPGSGGLHGPRGLIFGRLSPELRGDLLVANQNVNLPTNGDILMYSGFTGAFERVLVPPEPNGPATPRGMVQRDGVLYVADFGNFPDAPQGRIARYNGLNGAFLGDLNRAAFTGLFFPRAVVFSPHDGKLYVSNRPTILGGQVLRFDAQTGSFIDVFVDGDTCGCGLSRPEGLVFGPDGKLYVTSFQRSPEDTDKILAFNAAGQLAGQIPLDHPPGARAFAQALLFGPHGRLFVPITGPGPNVTGDPPNQFTGEVRRYNVSNGSYSVFIKPFVKGGPLEEPWYLTFCNTDPATLVYDDLDSSKRCAKH